MAKIMKEPELAAAMQKPQVMKAIMVREFFNFSISLFGPFSKEGKRPPLFLAAFSPPFPPLFLLSVCSRLFLSFCSSRRKREERPRAQKQPKEEKQTQKTHLSPPRPRNDKQKKTLNKKLKKKPKNEQEMQSDPMAFMKYTSDADVMLVLNKLQEMFGPAAAQMQAQQAAAGGGGPPPGSS